MANNLVVENSRHSDEVGYGAIEYFIMDSEKLLASLRLMFRVKCLLFLCAVLSLQLNAQVGVGSLREVELASRADELLKLDEGELDLAYANYTSYLETTPPIVSCQIVGKRYI